MSLHHSPRMVTDGLILYLDPANAKSLQSNTLVDLTTGSVSTISGTHGVDTTSHAVSVLELNNNGSTSNGQVQVVTQNLNDLALTQNFSVMFAAKKNFFGLAGNNNGNSQLFQGVTNGFNTGWRITESSQGTPGDQFTNRHSFVLGYNDINTALSVQDTGTVNRMCICAFTVSSSTIFAFLNGASTNTRTNPETYVSGTSQPRISFTGAGAGSWNGLVGFFAIYNRTLTLAEIQQNYNALRGRYGL